MQRGPAAAAHDTLRQLGDLCGHPVRVTVLDPLSHERLDRVAGVLASAGSAGLTVDCLRTAPSVPADAPLTVEVLVNGNMLWFHTTLRSIGGASLDKLHLNAPAAVQTLQRRRHPRVDLNIPVHLVLDRTGEPVSMTFRDLSAGGAALESKTPLPAGERVLLVFNLGSGLYFRDLEAETIRCTDGPDGRYVVALRFLCGKDQEEALAAWVSQKLSESDRSDEGVW